MLKGIKRWVDKVREAAVKSPHIINKEPLGSANTASQARAKSALMIVDAREEDIDNFLEAAQRAERINASPWVLRDEVRLDTLRRALEFVVNRGLWLQRDHQGVTHWQGRLLVMRHENDCALGMAFVCRQDDESAWQLRFFFIEPQWQERGHASRLLLRLREELRGSPLEARLPRHCSAAIRSLEKAGFERRYTNSQGVTHFEALAQWNEMNPVG